MKILALVAPSGPYGERIVAHLRQHAPNSWRILAIPAPSGLPPVIDEPEDYLPVGLPGANLVLYLGESERAVQLLPALATHTGAQAVIAPIDNAAWIPPGLRGQLTREFTKIGVEIVFPEPFCSLSANGLGPVAGEFARHFGRPRLRVRIDLVTEVLEEIVVDRGSPCGSTHFAAERAQGLPVAGVVPRAGLICLHYPCLASMQPEHTETGVETLMHTSGKIFNAALVEALATACQYPKSG